MGDGRLTGPGRVLRRRGLLGAPLVAMLASLVLAAEATAIADTTIESGPAEGSTINNAMPTFTFSAVPDLPGTTFECSVDGATFESCPDGNSHTTAELDDGPHTFAVRAVDLTTIPDDTPATRSFTVDTDPPDTTIDSGPGGATGDDTPRFTFSADEGGSTFECSIDGGTFEACVGPGDSHITDPLPDGPHTFEVRATDPAGNPDPTPATRDFTVDTANPNTAIDSGPSGATADDTPTFAFSSPDEPDSAFECRVDGGVYAPCSGPGDTHTTAPLADGPHSFEVRAVDAAGNRDLNPPIRTFTVDTTPPNTTIDSGPVGTVSDDTPTFTFSSAGGETFECRIDGDPFAPCSDPGAHTTAPLDDGPHTFAVRAIDAVGNFDPTPATQSFTVDTSLPPDTTAPDTTITKRPKGKIKTKKKKAKVKVSFRSEPGAAFTCRLDKGKYRPCTSPYVVKAKSKGGKGKKHRVSVRATDSSGNTGDPAVVSFRVQRAPRLGAARAERTVVTALRRHGFARRVWKSVRIDCNRRGRAAFGCRFSSRFPGYRLRGRGEVKLRARLSYRFRLRAQGVRFTLTDENEKRRLR